MPGVLDAQKLRAKASRSRLAKRDEQRHKAETVAPLEAEISRLRGRIRELTDSEATALHALAAWKPASNLGFSRDLNAALHRFPDLSLIPERAPKSHWPGVARHAATGTQVWKAEHRGFNTQFWIVFVFGRFEKYRRKSDALERFGTLCAVFGDGKNNRVRS